ncbi:MAG: mitochondrial fission ELM1 family protein [Thiobacillus sp.]|nr:mitochondrial fission ELM1 family protein [Thiobacillus sp.]
MAVWIVGDGKPGHLNQSRGLAEALARIVPAAIHELAALPAWQAGLAWLFGRTPAPALPKPDLIVGAGHATHLTLLAAGRATGAPTVVLMKPSLPRGWFDFVVVPAHDQVKANARTFVSQGALNRIAPVLNPDPVCSQRGLILVGGESRHFEWNSDAVATQIRSVVTRLPELRWTLTTSRRTPDDFVSRLPRFAALEVVPHTATSPDWLPARLAESGTVWVTPDSVSMVTEALTAGAAVGVFDLPVNPKSRVGWALADLADARRITRFIQWCAHGTLYPNTQPLAEADRCAAWLLACLKKN